MLKLTISGHDYYLDDDSVYLDEAKTILASRSEIKIWHRPDELVTITDESGVILDEIKLEDLF